MPTLQQKIAELFLAKLRESDHFDPSKVEPLRDLLQSKGKIKADELMKLFSQATGGDIK